jgi:hypothetical protein
MHQKYFLNQWRRWVLAGIGGGAAVLALTFAAPAADEKPLPDGVVQSIEKLKKDLSENPEAVRRLDELLNRLEKPLPGVRPPKAIAAPPPLPLNPPNFDDNFNRDLREMHEQSRRQMEELLKAMRANVGGNFQGGGIIIGPGGRMGGFGNLPMDGMAEFGIPRGARLGIRIERPSDVLVSQLELPNGQGLVCTDVPANSIAGQIGLKPNDILMEVDGKAVSNEGTEFVKQLKEIKGDKAVDVVVMRKGKKETLKGVKIPEPQIQNVEPVAPFNRPEPLRAPAANTEGVRVERSNDAFTIIVTKDGAKVTVAGSKEGAADAKPDSIEIEQDGKSNKIESIEQLPKGLQESVQKALKSIR